MARPVMTRGGHQPLCRLRRWAEKTGRRKTVFGYVVRLATVTLIIGLLLTVSAAAAQATGGALPGGVEIKLNNGSGGSIAVPLQVLLLLTLLTFIPALLISVT